MDDDLRVPEMDDDGGDDNARMLNTAEPHA